MSAEEAESKAASSSDRADEAAVEREENDDGVQQEHLLLPHQQQREESKPIAPVDEAQPESQRDDAKSLLAPPAAVDTARVGVRTLFALTVVIAIAFFLGPG